MRNTRLIRGRDVSEVPLTSRFPFLTTTTPTPSTPSMSTSDVPTSQQTDDPVLGQKRKRLPSEFFASLANNIRTEYKH